MSLTVEQAESAGRIATEISAVQTALTIAQGAVGAGVAISEIRALASAGDTGLVMHTNVMMTVEESASVLNTLISIYEARLVALQTQLNGLTD